MTPHPDARSDRPGTPLANPRRVRAAVSRSAASAPEREVVQQAPQR